MVFSNNLISVSPLLINLAPWRVLGIDEKNVNGRMKEKTICAGADETEAS